MKEQSAAEFRLLVRTSAALFLLIFLCGRIGLILHEYLGHGLAALLLGGELQSCRLFLFGGGWVETNLNSDSCLPHLIVALAGITVELITAFVLLFFSEKITIPLYQMIATSLAAVLLVHGFYYLSTGIYYGSGDGAMLYSRESFYSLSAVCLFFIAASLSAFFLSRAHADALIRWLGITGARSPLLILTGASVMAVSFHFGLTFIELQTVPHDHFSSVMQPKYEARIAKELERQLKELAVKTDPRTAMNARENITSRLRKKHTPFPLEIPLVLSILLFMIAGYMLRRKACTPSCSISIKDIHRMSLIILFLLGVILMLNRIYG